MQLPQSFAFWVPQWKIYARQHEDDTKKLLFSDDTKLWNLNTWMSIRRSHKEPIMIDKIYQTVTSA